MCGPAYARSLLRCLRFAPPVPPALSYSYTTSLLSFHLPSAPSFFCCTPTLSSHPTCSVRCLRALPRILPPHSPTLYVLLLLRTTCQACSPSYIRGFSRFSPRALCETAQSCSAEPRQEVVRNQGEAPRHKCLFAVRPGSNPGSASRAHVTFFPTRSSFGCLFTGLKTVASP